MNRPVIFPEGSYTLSDIQNFKNSNKIWQVLDHYPEQLEELFIIQNPAIRFEYNFKDLCKSFVEDNNKEGKGTIVYYPWSGALCRVLNEKDFHKVVTNRNQNIITNEEQRNLSAFKVGVLGLSIGNGMAVNLAYSGISMNMKIADFDTLDLSNLNRIRAGIHHLGVKKSDITCHQIFEVNPYANVEVYEEGVGKGNISRFLEEPKLDLVFEAIDDFEMKIKIRLVAREKKIPVIMLTNLGDRVLIDVERYDLERNLPIFNGLIGDVADEILNNPITESDKQKYAVAIVGKDNIPTRVEETINQINKTLVGRPQVMSTVTIGSGLASFLARKIALGEPLTSGRKMIDFQNIFSK